MNLNCVVKLCKLWIMIYCFRKKFLWCIWNMLESFSCDCVKVWKFCFFEYLLVYVWEFFGLGEKVWIYIFFMKIYFKDFKNFLRIVIYKCLIVNFYYKVIIEDMYLVLSDLVVIFFVVNDFFFDWWVVCFVVFFCFESFYIVLNFCWGLCKIFFWLNGFIVLKMDGIKCFLFFFFVFSDKIWGWFL